MSTSIKLNNGNSIPSIGLGVWRTAADEAAQAVYTALKAGYRHVDSAHAYGNEKEVVEGIAKFIKDTNTPRDQIWYTTKIRNPEHGYELTKKSLEERVAIAGPIGYIDLVLVHSPISDYEKRHGTWLALQEAVDAGTVKNIGVSNYGEKHISELLSYPDLKYKPVVNQIELHPWLNRTELVAFCESQGIKLEAYSPLVRGAKFGDPLLVELSKKYGVTEAQILVKWSLQKGFITLPKSVTESRIYSNFDVAFELSKEDVDRLAAKEEGPSREWDVVTYPLDHEESAVNKDKYIF